MNTPATPATPATRLSPPWVTFRKELAALFAEDPEVFVEAAPGNDTAILVRVCGNPAKADALGKLLPSERDFGGTKVTISVTPDNDTSTEAIVRTAFAGNPALVEVDTYTDALGHPVTYAFFAPVAEQYYNDDASHPDGLTTRLVQDIARDALTGINFRITTALKD